MSLVLCKNVSLGRWKAYCEACGAEIGILDQEEVQALARGVERVLCFDCDGIKSDRYHSLFSWDGEAYWLFLDGYRFLMDWPKSVREQQQRIAHYKTTIKEFFVFLEDSRKGESLACQSVHNSTKFTQIEGYNGKE